MLGIGICKKEELNTKSIGCVFSANEIEFVNSIDEKMRSLTMQKISAVKKALKDLFEIEENQFNLIDVKFENNTVKISVNDDLLKKQCYCRDISVKTEGDIVVCVLNNNDNKRNLFLKATKKANSYDENTINTSLAKNIFPKRTHNSHKGDYGKVFVVGSSCGLSGAALFAADACVKCGSGLVSLGCPRSMNNIFETYMREIMTLPLPENEGKLSKKSLATILEKCNTSDVLLLGCGMGISDDTVSLVSDIISEVKIPIVIDADGINALSKNINVLKKHNQPIVITPHFMEFARLTGRSIGYISENAVKCAVEFSKEYNVTTVLKSHNTVVSDENGNYKVNMLGNSGMATGGSGDVLAGAVASFIGQKLSCFDASLFGVFVHSLAGDMSMHEFGMHSMTPTDILNNIPYALKYLGG